MSDRLRDLARQSIALGHQMLALAAELDPAPEPTLDYPWVPGRYQGRGAQFAAAPDLVVIHSGHRSPGVAEYLARPNLERAVSAHFAWSSKRDALVQMEHVDRAAWHAGGSKFLGAGDANQRSIGIELPGPWHLDPRPDDQREQLRELLTALRPHMAAHCYLTGHEFVRETKRDPGPGVDASWFEGLGYDVIWRDCQEML